MNMKPIAFLFPISNRLLTTALRVRPTMTSSSNLSPSINIQQFYFGRFQASNKQLSSLSSPLKFNIKLTLRLTIHITNTKLKNMVREIEVESKKNSENLKFLCSYDGKILPRSSDGQLRYVGGITRVFSVERSVSFAELMVKLGEFCGSSVTLRCQLPNGDLETLISIKSDEDLTNLVQEYDRAAPISKIRAILSTPASLKQISPPPSVDFPSAKPSFTAVDRCSRSQPSSPTFGYVIGSQPSSTPFGYVRVSRHSSPPIGYVKPSRSSSPTLGYPAYRKVSHYPIQAQGNLRSLYCPRTYRN
ncbi:hypothetical protein Pint_15535 [Pistacia integerrima]|uniref:Uncharacterized protein n=1 Tax=Pistacia integerrima TaxID=434235 RepID=A0ACC0ZDR1_9ROSI|nr:hypothetical protein Pint_15535 [Pistacia integerrima]